MFQEMTQLCWMTQQYIWRPNDISLWSCIVKENKIMFSDVLKVYWKSRLWLIKSWVRQGVYLFFFFFWRATDLKHISLLWLQKWWIRFMYPMLLRILMSLFTELNGYIYKSCLCKFFMLLFVFSYLLSPNMHTIWHSWKLFQKHFSKCYTISLLWLDCYSQRGSN